jgi:hypothetical protein
MVGERGFEPPTPWSRTPKIKLQVLDLVSLRSQKAHSFSNLQTYRSYTEFKGFIAKIAILQTLQ